MITYLNGSYQPKEGVRIAPDDRGFLFGDGAYEVTRTYQGALFALDRHLDRLRYSLAQLRIAGVDVGCLGEVSRELLHRNQLERTDAIVYLQVTRGAAPRTHGFPREPVAPTVYGYAAPLASRFDAERGVAAITVPDVRWARCDIKSVALVANVLANQAAQEAGVFEALLVRDGVVLEGSHTSLFAVVEGEVRTVPLTNYVLPGITRALVLEICRTRGIPVRETPLFAHELPRANEVFLAGTTTEVLGVVTIDGRVIGDGGPGPLTRKLHQLFLAETRR